MTAGTAAAPIAPWMDAATAAAYVGENEYTLRAAARDGRVRGHQRAERGRWRFHRDDLDAYVRGERPEVATPLDARTREGRRRVPGR